VLFDGVAVGGDGVFVNGSTCDGVVEDIAVGNSVAIIKKLRKSSAIERPENCWYRFSPNSNMNSVRIIPKTERCTLYSPWMGCSTIGIPNAS